MTRETLPGGQPASVIGACQLPTRSNSHEHKEYDLHVAIAIMWQCSAVYEKIRQRHLVKLDTGSQPEAISHHSRKVQRKPRNFCISHPLALVVRFPLERIM
jgi:hypothetical protein